ncbi:MAG: alpha-L-fucosidase [Eubacteriales bacterium]
MYRYPLPTQKQEEWANMELGVIIHHCMEVYHPDIPPSEWKTSPERMPAESFAPVDENTDQWLEAAAAMGAKYAVLVTNHVTGFSLWPTKENAYSIASSPFRGGQADVVRDFMASCKKYGIRPGLYYSTGCNGYYGINDSVKQDYLSPAYQNYVRMVERQLGEIWGNYGELFEIWFDGGVIPHRLGGPDVVGLIRKYQPNAICFQGPKEHHQNLRWVGNERGLAPLDCWSTSKINTCGFGGDEENGVIGSGSPDGTYWIPAETDMANRKQNAFGGGWGWAADEEHLVYTPEELLERYITSVGRNSNLLLGMGISTYGHFEDTDQFIRFGQLIRALYKNPIASCRGTGNTFTLTLEGVRRVSNLMLAEDIRYGERVRDFLVETEKDGCWVPFFDAHCIGHKRIVPIHDAVSAVRLTIRSAVDTPIIKEMTCFG